MGKAVMLPSSSPCEGGGRPVDPIVAVFSLVLGDVRSLTLGSGCRPPRDEWRVIMPMAAYMLGCPLTEIHLEQSDTIVMHQMQVWEPRVVVCCSSTVPPTSLGVPVVVVCEEDMSQGRETSLEDMLLQTQGRGVEEVAFIEWTSGSTGLPKGCRTTHKSLANMAFWRWWEFPTSPGEEFRCAMNLFFVWYWFIPLQQGGTLIIIPDEVQINAPVLVDFLATHRCTRWDCISPTLLRTLLQVCSHDTLERLRELTIMHSGGELLEVDTCRMFHQELPWMRLINGFATTETGCDFTYCEMTPALTAELSAQKQFAAPIRHRAGRGSWAGLCWNTKAVLHSLPQEVEGFPEEAGQLVCTGYAAAEGYYKSPQQTEGKFEQTGARSCNEAFVKLGDVAMRLHVADESYLTVLGRFDAVVKIRGFRVELGLVEEAVKTLDMVMDAGVVKCGDTLVAFATLVDDGEAESPKPLPYAPMNPWREQGDPKDLTLSPSLRASPLVQPLVGLDVPRLEQDSDSDEHEQLERSKEELQRASREIRELLRRDGGLPKGHMPDEILVVHHLPMSLSGKINRKKLQQLYKEKKEERIAYTSGSSNASLALPPHGRSLTATVASAEEATSYEVQARVREAWCTVLGHADFDDTTNFFECGGHSLLVMRLAAIFEISPVQILAAPTVAGQVSLLEALPGTSAGIMVSGAPTVGIPRSITGGTGEDVAVVGVAIRFPMANNVDEFWEKLVAGRECGREHSVAEMVAAGIGPERYQHPHWVNRSSAPSPDIIEGFDHELFGMSHTEAVLTDPSQRLLLECAYEVLESTGHGAQKDALDCGVFMSGGALPHYLTDAIGDHESRQHDPGRYMQLEVGNDKDYIATRVAYKLNCTGPAKTIQTACSSSLVCIADAAHAVRWGQCGLALAGGSHIAVPHSTGYLHEPGMIWSPDGRCRPFDTKGQGVYEASAAGVVLLKPLSAVDPSSETIYGIIRGAAVNNDGSSKAGYYAPSVQGQASVIQKALDDAGVAAKDISYVECHGTGTKLGDPIEIAALSQAHSAAGDGVLPRCQIGSVKSNLGHAGAAAGVVGFVKAILCLHHKCIPPTLHYDSPNPAMALDATRFDVAHGKSKEWSLSPELTKRLCGVSSFGIGGTNAHVIVEEHVADPCRAQESLPSISDASSFLLLSAATPRSLSQSLEAVQGCFTPWDPTNIYDIEHTLMTKRRVYPHREVLVCHHATGTVEAVSPQGGSSPIAEASCWLLGHSILQPRCVRGSNACAKNHPHSRLTSATSAKRAVLT